VTTPPAHRKGVRVDGDDCGITDKGYLNVRVRREAVNTRRANSDQREVDIDAVLSVNASMARFTAMMTPSGRMCRRPS
jgi:hypothetical protein